MPKKCTYILSNEQGEVVQSKEIELDLVGDKYYTDIKEEILQGKERKVTILVKNEKGEVIGQEVLEVEMDPQVLNKDVASNILEEDINEKGEKKVSIYPEQKSMLVMKFDDIKEVESKLEQDSVIDNKEKVKKFEEMLEKYGGRSDSTRLSVNTRKPNEIRPKSNTFNVKQQKKNQE